MSREYNRFTSQMGWYTIQYPKDWMVEIIENIPAFYDPDDGSGALQISSFVNKKGFYELDSVMSQYLSQHGISFDSERTLATVDTDGNTIMSCEFISQQRFWMVYMVAFGNKLLICTYNSDEAPDPELSKILSYMLSSIKIFNNN